MKLGVNIDHVATLRQARLGAKPDILQAAEICKRAGADSIVVHLREDRRHIQDRDVKFLRKRIKLNLNLEMSMANSIVDIACKIRPDRSTLVPEKRQELTTEGGLDVFRQFNRVVKVVDKLRLNGVETSLFIDPVKKQIRASKDAGCRFIELHTGRYADARTSASRQRYLGQLKLAARFAKGIGGCRSNAAGVHQHYLKRCRSHGRKGSVNNSNQNGRC